MFPSTQMPAISVKVGVDGSADALRVRHSSLPSRGTYGLVGFIGNDNRSAIWIKSVYVQQMDAFAGDDDPTLDYHSHWSGYYELVNQNGDFAQSFPDGTFLVVSGAAMKPEMSRHIVDQQQNRQKIPFPDSERVPSPPPAKHFYISTKGGLTFHVDPNGKLTVETLTDSLNFIAPADILLGALGETLYRLIDERLIALFNAHVHSGVQGGSGSSGPPTTPMTVGGQTTTVVKAG